MKRETLPHPKKKRRKFSNALIFKWEAGVEWCLLSISQTKMSRGLADLLLNILLGEQQE